jgi:hypothetical protein
MRHCHECCDLPILAHCGLAAYSPERGDKVVWHREYEIETIGVAFPGCRGVMRRLMMIYTAKTATSNFQRANIQKRAPWFRARAQQV